MLPVYQSTNYQLCDLTLYHYGYLRVTPHPGHFGFHLVPESAQDLVDAIRGVFPEVK